MSQSWETTWEVKAYRKWAKIGGALTSTQIWVQGQPGLHREFQNIQGYVEGPVLQLNTSPLTHGREAKREAGRQQIA